jgi:HK97 family phage prohead protease
MMDHRNRAKLIDVPERRDLVQPLEFREDAANGDIILEGYAATWDPYDCYGGPERGGWVEQIDPSAVKRTLAEKPDLMLLINHEGLPIARTTSGNLDLSTDSHGLFVRARLDPSDPDVQRLAPKMKNRGKGNRPLMDEMSFAFRVKDQDWDQNYTNRKITELSLQKGDVSVVNYGMNPNTRTALNDAMGSLTSLSDKELVEVRNSAPPQVAEAIDILRRAWRSGEKPPNDPDSDDDPDKKKAKKHNNEKGDDLNGRGATVDFNGSHLLYDGQCVTCSSTRMGMAEGTPYADPGYLDSERQAASNNGVQRLPMDETHVRASWTHVQQPKNQRGYSIDQLASIKVALRAARKKFGQDDEKPADQADKDQDKDKVTDKKSQAEAGTPVEISHIEQVRKFGGGVTLVAVMTDGTRTPLPSFRTDAAPPVPTAAIPALDASKLVSGVSGFLGFGQDARMTETENGKKVVHPDDDDDDDEDRAGKPPWVKDDDDDDEDEKKGKVPPQFIDQIHDKEKGKDKGDDAGNDDDPKKKKGDPSPKGDQRDDDEPDKRSIEDRLAAIRRPGDLPPKVSVSDGLAYIKSLA